MVLRNLGRPVRRDGLDKGSKGRWGERGVSRSGSIPWVTVCVGETYVTDGWRTGGVRGQTGSGDGRSGRRSPGRKEVSQEVRHRPSDG